MANIGGEFTKSVTVVENITDAARKVFVSRIYVNHTDEPAAHWKHRKSRHR